MKILTSTHEIHNQTHQAEKRKHRFTKCNLTTVIDKPIDHFSRRKRCQQREQRQRSDPSAPWPAQRRTARSTRLMAIGAIFAARSPIGIG
uniref:Uncharacterized protein n=1 Tax=Arundo donax TaxID=35708 RepID=A0A0A9AE56_ARUDO